MAELLSKAPGTCDDVDEELLQGFWEASRVSFRLLMFQVRRYSSVAFLYLLG